MPAPEAELNCARKSGLEVFASCSERFHRRLFPRKCTTEDGGRGPASALVPFALEANDSMRQLCLWARRKVPRQLWVLGTRERNIHGVLQRTLAQKYRA